MKYESLKAIILMIIFILSTNFAVADEDYISNSMEIDIMVNDVWNLVDFSNIEIGMTRDEIVQIIGEPTDIVGSGIIWDRYKLEDGWYMNLLYTGYDCNLVVMEIVNYTNITNIEIFRLVSESK
jgi:hypothetical protein